MSGRRGPLLVGALLFAVGVAILLVHSLASLVSLDPLVQQLGHDYLVVAFVGFLALALAILVIFLRSFHGFEQAKPPSAESIPAGQPLGAEIDRVIEDGLDPLAHLTATPRTTVRERLRRAAIETVRRVDGCSTAAASASVSAGEWTDDGAAAAFLADEGPEPPVRRLRDALPGQSQFRQRTDSAVTAILDRDQQEGEP